MEQEPALQNKSHKKTSVSTPSEPSIIEEKSSLHRRSPSAALRHHSKGDKVHGMESSKREGTEIPHNPATWKSSGTSIIPNLSKLLFRSTGADSQQQLEGRGRSEQSRSGPDSCNQHQASPGGFASGESVEPPVPHKPVTARQARDSESDKRAVRASEKDMQCSIHMLTRENDRLKQELGDQHEVMAIRESEYIDHITSLESELRKLRAEKEDLSQNLESCKDRIFNMLPVEGMADTQLQSQYTTLCKTIEYWLDNQFDDAEDFIGTLAWVGKSEDRRNLVSEYLPQRYLTLAGEDRNVQIPIMQVLVARYLHQNLLEKDRIFPGLDPSTEACLGMVIDGLHALNPAKDKDAILMWAVDLQRAFNTNERFKEQRQKKLSEIEAVIMHCPMLLKEMGLHGRSNDPVICREIVKEAADLANNIRQSMAEYAFDFRVGSAVLFEEKVKNFTVIDCGTGSTLSSSAVPIPGPDGRVGEILFLVYPAFVRKSTGSSKEIVLVKPTILVKFDQPVPRGKRSKSSH
ncbi:uncharacterized protein Z520_03232 [Fonsecaea multimorphosa CBS 102226]|uniref:Uncharacterized protein n=1 Tax=Fonsecaea multimorphosa CBS 102226 TaxID=1442371 RepID=A0A0D2KUZ1_9EURO|nr:uncharacterized protein Z520_03232 [Fonsecaea multimorphosa CBS 102226]KIY00569.1 hypothetical protein Z520_03232 [Fonsecaea multimorphosa CBS 102226]